MGGVKDSKNIDDLRKRLYARSSDEVRVGRHDLSPSQHDVVPNVWRDAQAETSSAVSSSESAKNQADTPSPATRQYTAQSARRGSAPVSSATPAAAKESNTKEDTAEPAPIPTTFTAPKRQRSYRKYIAIFATLIFIGGVAFSSFYLFFGLNEISSSNIVIDIEAPSSIGSGETMPIDITIRNDNPAPVVSATLIVDYPSGTRSVEDTGRNVQTERIPLDSFDPGQAQEIPVRAVVFGEVDEEKEIRVRFEYRIQGTNSTLERRVDPIEFRITSAPLVVRVDSINQVTAGQEVDMTLTVESNAPNTLHNVLVTATYPSGFDYTDARPSPSFGNNTWQISSIEPGATETIRITGAFIGNQDDEFVVNFSTGVPRTDNQYILDATFSTTRSEFVIEQPFIGVRVQAGGQEGDLIVLDSSGRTNIDMYVNNTLPEPVFDMYVTVALSGNAMNPDDVRVGGGFYDSNTGAVRFDVSTDRTLTEVPAGASRSFNFSIEPERVGTGQIDMEVNVFARRVFQERVQEQLIASNVTTIQYSSIIDMQAQVDYTAGPMPPVAEQDTTYTINLFADAGVNDLVDGVVTTSLPTYVTWLDTYDGPGSVVYNPVNREITWQVGDISAEERAQLAMQVEIRPSRSQVGNRPALVNQQHFRATDRFTGTIVRETGSPVSTELERSRGFERNNGMVRAAGVANDEEN